MTRSWKQKLSSLGRRAFRGALALGVAAGAAALPVTAPMAGPGHNHGAEQALPAVSLEDLRPRAMAAGTWFEIVAMPVSGALAIFLDNADTNEPVLDAYLELLTVADEPLIAEEVVPGVYLASPWPPAGVDPEALRGSDVVVTAIAEAGEDLLVVGLSDALVDFSLENGETPGAAKTSLTDGVEEIASADGGGLWLVLVGGLISLAGLSAGIRYRGITRWVGMSAVVVGLAMGISTTGLV